MWYKGVAWEATRVATLAGVTHCKNFGGEEWRGNVKLFTVMHLRRKRWWHREDNNAEDDAEEQDTLTPNVCFKCADQPDHARLRYCPETPRWGTPRELPELPEPRRPLFTCKE